MGRCSKWCGNLGIDSPDMNKGCCSFWGQRRTGKPVEI